MATRPTWIKDKKVKLLVQFGAEKEPALPTFRSRQILPRPPPTSC